MSDERIQVVLYTQPHCIPCHQVVRFLSERGVAFSEHDISRDAAALQSLVERGFMGTPVTRVGEWWVAGFNRPELERALDATAGADRPGGTNNE